MQRSGKPPDMKQLELNISQQNLEREQTKLRVHEGDAGRPTCRRSRPTSSIITAKLDNARTNREQALVRSPLDGVVVQIYTRQGERVSATASPRSST